MSGLNPTDPRRASTANPLALAANKEHGMPIAEAPVDLYIATYINQQAAERDWNNIKQMTTNNIIDVEGLTFVRRDGEGKIQVKDDAREIGKAPGVGAVASAVVGMIFPATILGG